MRGGNVRVRLYRGTVGTTESGSSTRTWTLAHTAYATRRDLRGNVSDNADQEQSERITVFMIRTPLSNIPQADWRLVDEYNQQYVIASALLAPPRGVHMRLECASSVDDERIE